jgi:hypothetical protein
LNFLAWLFLACIGFYIAPAGRRLVAAGGAMPLFGVAQPVESRFSILLPRRGKGVHPLRRFLRPIRGGPIEYFFHGFRFAGFAGCASPVATICRPFGAKNTRLTTIATRCYTVP